MGENHALDDLDRISDHLLNRLASPEDLSKLSDAQLRRRQSHQAKLTMVGATIGVAALGAKGGASVVRRAVKPVARGEKIASGIERHQTGMLTLGAGIGGVGGFNSASIYRAESKKRQQHIVKQPVKKDWTEFNRRRKVDPLVRQYGRSKPLPGDLSREKRQAVWEAREKHINRKRNQWERTGHGLNATQIAGETVASGVGAALGAGALRDQYEKENPGKLATKLEGKSSTVRRVVNAKPKSFKVLLIGGSAAAAAAGARQGKRVAQRKTRKYSSREGGTASAALTRMNKSMSAFGVDHR